MAYETLINSSISHSSQPAHKPHYTPLKSLKKALKLVRILFKKSRKHQQFCNDSSYEHPNMTFSNDDQTQQQHHLTTGTAEECDNYANECREAAAIYVEIW